ncbi:exopolysaccharide biosynthesis protein [Oceanicola sp. D3]|uniref:exopolysaccharide biosynthesis protein n=1 Tax=Oceanicola sp. D3 TaxID=2587163 RepID=UPI0020C809F1|nr:exopolysaccharide biosynthesis protein [Oceanicola sp. D3]
MLDALDGLTSAKTVSVQDLLEEVGVRAFAPLILIPALILVTPISGIPGLPTLGAVLIGLVIVQKLLGREHLWLPGWLTRRKVRGEKLADAVDWMRKPCHWIDKHSRKRLSPLVSRPANLLAAVVITLICVIIPFLELLPMVTSLFAVVISLFAIGLLLRDGLFTLVGYLWIGVAAGAIYWLTG